jgi:Rad3-related DNA helicase
MYEIAKKNIVSETDQLLFNILEELKNIHTELKKLNGTKEKKPANKVICKVCNKEFENKGQYLAHCRTDEHKKKVKK